MKKLGQILLAKDTLELIGSLDTIVNDITFDSRQVKKGSCFIAVRGTQADGHGYIDKAVELGASAIVCEVLPEKMVKGITYARVKDTTEVLGRH